MLIVLGLFLAGFFMFIFAPVYRRRAERLATNALRSSMPLTEAEIRADKDRLRAEHAITIHQLEAKGEQSALSAARQMVEINRRDAVISALEGQVADMRTSLDEHENARRVLEQTITDRLPRVEARLMQAKTQLDERDHEITTLTASAHKYASALNEAHQINRQQREELSRMSSSVTTRSYRNRDAGGDHAADRDVALRAEIEALRAKSREQSALIERLQSAAQAAPAAIFAHLGQIANDDSLGDAARHDKDISRLTSSLSEAEKAMKAVAGEPGLLSPALEKRLEVQAALIESHETEIARMKAELAAAHDRLSQQAAKHSEELSSAAAAADAAASAIQVEVPKKVPLIERIAAPRVDAPVETATKTESAPQSGFIRALVGGAGFPAANAAKTAAEEPAQSSDETTGLEKPATSSADTNGPNPLRLHRGGLIERLAGAKAKPALPVE